jgi:hypothetical protein
VQGRAQAQRAAGHSAVLYMGRRPAVHPARVVRGARAQAPCGPLVPATSSLYSQSLPSLSPTRAPSSFSQTPTLVHTLSLQQTVQSFVSDSVGFSSVHFAVHCLGRPLSPVSWTPPPTNPHHLVSGTTVWRTC